MNIASLGLLMHKVNNFGLLSKPLLSFICCKSYFSSKCYQRNEFNINCINQMKFERSKLRSGIFLQVHANGYRTFRRRPINIIEHNVGKPLQDYVSESLAQAANVANDEVISRIYPRETETGPKKSHSYDEEPLARKQRLPTFKAPKSKSKNIQDDDVDDIDKKVLKNLNIKLYKHAQHKVNSLLEMGKSSKLRQKHNVFLLEGWRLLLDALSVGLKPTAIFFSRSSLFLNMIPSMAQNEEELANFLNLFDLYKTPYSTFQTWSNLVTPPGIIAAFPLVPAKQLCTDPKPSSFPLVVVIDEIRDPNNLGSIMRTLAAAGVHKTILTKGCCDLWDMKVLRGASGAHFRMNCVTKVPWSSVESHFPANSPVYLADACKEMEEGAEEQDRDTGLNKSCEQLMDLAQAESGRQTSYEVDREGQKIIHNDSYNDLNHLSHFERVTLPQSQYNALNFFNSSDNSEHLVLVLGGETGLSNCAKKLAVERGGSQLSIPMLNGVESLNSSVATGIMVYEMLMQHRSLRKRESEVKIVN